MCCVIRGAVNKWLEEVDSALQPGERPFLITPPASWKKADEANREQADDGIASDLFASDGITSDGFIPSGHVGQGGGNSQVANGGKRGKKRKRKRVKQEEKQGGKKGKGNRNYVKQITSSYYC